MKCKFCGFEYENNLCFCPACGKQLADEALSLNPVADRISHVFNDSLFLVTCILMSVSAVLNLFMGGGLPVFEILFTIFLWLCFAQGKKGFIDHSHLRSISGTVYAYYIVNFVLSGILAIFGFSISALVGIIQNTPEIFEELSDEIDLASTFEGLEFLEGLEGFGDIIGGVVIILFLIIAVAFILINIFGIRKIHKFVQSVYKSIEFNENRIACAKTAKNWLIVLGALGVAGSVLSFSSLTALQGIAEAGSSLCGIFAGVLINKHILVD